MADVILAVVSTLLAVSAAANAYAYATRHRFQVEWLSRETRALDRARAAELRSAEQIDAMLERVSTAPRLDLEAGRQAVEVDPSLRKFYADDDDPTEYQAWNEAHGEADEDSE